MVVVCPLNSIMDDQMKFLKNVGISCGKMNLVELSKSPSKLFQKDHCTPATSVNDSCQDEVDKPVLDDDDDDDDDDADADIDFALEKMVLPSIDVSDIPLDILEGRCQIVFGHPEAILSPVGRKVLGSEVYQKNVVAITIDEAHCVETW